MVSNQLINKCKKGNQRAYKELYETSVPYVFSIVKRYIFNDVVWKDLVQEVYAKTFSSLSKFDPGKGEFKFYLRKITVNTCLMYMRKHKKTPLFSSLSDVEEPKINDFAQDQFLNLSRTDIEGLLVGMPDGYKTVFLLHIIDEFEYDEISEMLNITRETVRSQLFRAKKWIMKKSIIDHKTSSYGLF